MVLAWELWNLPKYNRPTKRKEITNLVIKDALREYHEGKNIIGKFTVFFEWRLEGELDLSDFVNLEHLDCSNNKLIRLNVSNCLKLKDLYCQENRLTSLELPINSKIINLNINDNLLNDYSIFNKISRNLILLDIRDNKFPQKDLIFLRKFKKLEVLKLGRKELNSSYLFKSVHEIHINTFNGSLLHLENMTELNVLSILNTNINEGLEYLPDSLKKIRCGTTANHTLYSCHKICGELKNKGCLSDNKHVYELEKWRNSSVSYKRIKEFRKQINLSQKELNMVNVLLIGSISSKSRLINILTGNSNPREKDKMNVTLEEGDINYNIVHTGIDSSILTQQKVLGNAKNAIDLLSSGINQIFFIVDENCGKDAYHVLMDIFDDDVTDNVTFVSTHYDRNNDIENMKKGDEKGIREGDFNRIELLRLLKDYDRVYIPNNLSENLEELTNQINKHHIPDRPIDVQMIIDEIHRARDMIIDVVQSEFHDMHQHLDEMKNLKRAELAVRGLEATASLVTSSVKVATLVGCVII